LFRFPDFLKENDKRSYLGGLIKSNKVLFGGQKLTKVFLNCLFSTDKQNNKKERKNGQ
jgi:hypothetical protein